MMRAYKKPRDIKSLEELYPINKKIFSAMLIKARLHLMDEATKARAMKTINSLETNEAFNVMVPKVRRPW